MRLCEQARSVVHIVLVVALRFDSATCQRQCLQDDLHCKEGGDTTALLQSHLNLPSQRSKHVNMHFGTQRDETQLSSLAAKIGSQVSVVMAGMCDELKIDCRNEKMSILVIGGSLIGAISFVLLMYCFLTDEKDQHVTPLCPRLLVGARGLNFQMSMDSKATGIDEFEAVDTDDTSNVLAQVQLTWLDPTQSVSSRLVAIARLNSTGGIRLGSVVARHVACAGQGLAICRPYSEETFAFVVAEKEGMASNAKVYKVMHRTGLPLMNLAYDTAKNEIHGVSSTGTVVFYVKMENDTCHARVAPTVDAGLVLCSILGVCMHQRIVQDKASGSDPLLSSPSDPFLHRPSSQAPDNSEPAPGPSGAASSWSFTST